MSRKLIILLSSTGVLLTLFPLACAVFPTTPEPHVSVPEGAEASARDAGLRPSRTNGKSAPELAPAAELKPPGRSPGDYRTKPSVDQDRAKAQVGEGIREDAAARGEESRDAGVKTVSEGKTSAASNKRSSTVYGSPHLDARMLGPRVPRVPRGTLELGFRIYGVGNLPSLSSKFIVGDALVLGVWLSNCEASSLVTQRTTRRRHAAYLSASKGLSKEEASRAVGLDKVEDERIEALRVGQGALGWIEHLRISVHKLSDSSPGKQEHITDVHATNGALLEATSQKEMFIEMRLKSDWRFDTHGWQPGTYLVSAVFEVKAEEAREPDMWQGKVERTGKFTLTTRARASKEIATRSSYSKGVAALRDRRYDDCIAFAKEVAGSSSGYVALRAHSMMAKAYEAKGQTEKAIRTYEEAIELAGGRGCFLLQAIKRDLDRLRAAGARNSGDTITHEKE